MKMGNDVWFGIHVVIQRGTIGDGEAISAENIVTKDVGSYENCAGNPARFIRKHFEDETIKNEISVIELGK